MSIKFSERLANIVDVCIEKGLGEWGATGYFYINDFEEFKEFLKPYNLSTLKRQFNYYGFTVSYNPKCAYFGHSSFTKDNYKSTILMTTKYRSRKTIKGLNRNKVNRTKVNRTKKRRTLFGRRRPKKKRTNEDTVSPTHLINEEINEEINTIIDGNSRYSTPDLILEPIHMDNLPCESIVDSTSILDSVLRYYSVAKISEEDMF